MNESIRVGEGHFSAGRDDQSIGRIDWQWEILERLLNYWLLWRRAAISIRESNDGIETCVNDSNELRYQFERLLLMVNTPLILIWELCRSGCNQLLVVEYIYNIHQIYEQYK